MSAPSQGQSRRQGESGKPNPIFFLSVPDGGGLQMKKYGQRAHRSLRFGGNLPSLIEMAAFAIIFFLVPILPSDILKRSRSPPVR